VTPGGDISSELLVLCSFPFSIGSLDPALNLQVVGSSIDGESLLEDIKVHSLIKSVVLSKSSEFGVVGNTVLEGLRKGLLEGLELSGKLGKI